MTRAVERVGGGMPSGQAIACGGGYASVAAAGSAQSDATVIVASANIVTGADGNTGIRLPATNAGDEIWVFNNSGSTLKVYPSSGGAISVGGTGLGTTDAAFSQLTYKATIYKCFTSLQWIAITSV